MHFISLPQSAQNGHRILDGGLRHQHRLKSALQCRVFLDTLAVFIKRRRTDAAQITPCQRRLQHIRGIHCSFCGACSYKGVDLVDEQDDIAGRLFDLPQYRFQAVLELPAELAAGHEGAHIQCHDPAIL